MLRIYAIFILVIACQKNFEAFRIPKSLGLHRSVLENSQRVRIFSPCMSTDDSSEENGQSTTKVLSEKERIDLWKTISKLEKDAVELLANGKEKSVEEAFKLLSQSVSLKKNDPFLHLADLYSTAVKDDKTEDCEKYMRAMKITNVPPHLSSLARLNERSSKESAEIDDEEDVVIEEEIDAGSTFSDTVTEKVRVKVNSYYDTEKSDPDNGKYMFWYKVAIYNEGPEPVQIVARMWEIEKCKGEKEVVRGAGIMSTQPIIPPGDVFTYQSVCPLKVFPPKGRRLLGSMSGAYTLCKGNMGQHNFTVKVSKFNLILPESTVSE